MHIKQIVIEGFKSYKDQVISEPFSPGINVVVGANGSGKSNFFHAIRFVLNDVFTMMKAEERQSLLHEGAGHAVMSAYVEVVFDNSDRRFPVDKDEVRLRRTISLKKDEYHLDKKAITKREVQNLLESAGFSSANPYYVVQQGKIMAMSTMKDHERLELLKEIGGTKVYEERCADSLRMMSEAETRRGQIQELVSYIEEKLSELDADRAELLQYQELDKQRRALEYAVLDREKNDVEGRLAKVQEEYNALKAAGGPARQQLQQTAARLADVEQSLAAKQAKAGEAGKAKKGVTAKREAAQKQAMKIEVDVKEMEEQVATGQQSHEAAAAQLQEVLQQEEQVQGQLAEAAAALHSLDAQLAQLTGQVEECRAREQAVLQKQGRKSQFKSAAERDRWLQKSIRDAQAARTKQVATRDAMQASLQQLRDEANDRAAKMGDGERLLQLKKQELESAESSYSSCVSSLEAVTSRAAELQRRAEQLRRSAKEVEALRDGHREALYRMQPRDQAAAAKHMEAICREQQIQMGGQLLGQLIELVECAEVLQRPVEVVAKERLFFTVVDTYDTTSRIMDALRKKAGRTTFIALERIRAEKRRYPSEWGDKVVPLTKFVKAKDQRAQVLIDQVFGHTLVCDSLSLCSTVARQTGFDCITMEGDLVSRKGAITGGYMEEQRAKLKVWQECQAAGAELQQLQQQLSQVEGELAEVQQEQGRGSSERSKAQARIRALKDGLASQKRELEALAATARRDSAAIDKKEAEVQRFEAAVRNSDREIAARTAELGTPLQDGLTAEDREALAAARARLSDLQQQLEVLQAERDQAAAHHAALQAQLTENLQRQRTELQRRLDGLAAGGVSGAQLEARRAELQGAQHKLQQLQQQEAELDAELAELSKETAELASKRDALRETASAGEVAAAERSRQLGEREDKGEQLRGRHKELEGKVRALGTLPADAFDKYRGRALGELRKQLTKVLKELEKFAHVNKKALDQYVNFNEQRQQLVGRHKEGDVNESKIRELIHVLDMRKDEAIERTFKGVARHFREVFAELVPGGRGELVMQRAGPRPGAAGGGGADEEGAGPSSGAKMDKYSGVKVKVSFGAGETMTMAQLSGGQKTLVALALIFAIQRCDPAPFYLFDEIDAALDPQYRTSVAETIRKQANDSNNPAQFIVTTFHQQIVEKCDKVYGVAHQNRISGIDVISREHALSFLRLESEAAAQAAREEEEGRAQRQGQGKRKR